MRIVVLFFLLIGLFGLVIYPVQSQTLPWANAHVGAGVYTTAVVVDAGGNAYVGGGFTTSATIGTTVLRTTVANRSGAFIAKYNPVGALLWVRQPAMSATDASLAITDIKLDPSGNPVVAGVYVAGTWSLDGFTLPVAPWGTNYSQGFVAKLTPQGMVVWVEGVGDAAGSATATALAVDDTGNLYVGGIWHDTAVLLRKYSETGTLLFTVNSPPGGARCQVRSLAVSANGRHLALCGSVSGGGLILNPAVGPIPAVEVIGASLGSSPGFVAGYSATGVAMWANTLTSTNRLGNMRQIVASGDCFYAVGSSIGTATFGNVAPIALPGVPYQYNSVLVRCDTLGIVQWTRSAVGNVNVFNNCIAADAGGNLHVGGTLGSLAGAAGGVLSVGGFTLTGNGATDLFVLTYSPQGVVRGAQLVGGAATEELWDLALGATGQPYVVGYYVGGAALLSGIALPVSLNINGYVARLAAIPLAARSSVLAPAALTAAPSPARPGDTWQLAIDAALTTAPATLRVVNVLGQEVRRQLLPAGSTSLTVPTAGLPAGRYVLQVTGATAVATRAVVLE